MSTANSRSKTKAPQAPTRRRRRAPGGCAPDQGDGIGDYLFGPSDEAKAIVAEIRERWAKLQTWGVRDKLPFTRGQQQALISFFASWDKDPKPAEIAGTSSDLVAMERYAEEYDRKHGGSFRAGPIATRFDSDNSSRFRQVAAASDSAAKEVTAVVKEAGKDLIDATKPLLQEISTPFPLVFGLGAAVALVSLVVLVKSAPRVPYYVKTPVF